MKTEGENRRIQRALSSVEALQTICYGYPPQRAARPCATFLLAGENAADVRDGQTYLTEKEYYVRCHARRMEELEELAPQIEAAMESVGYRRSFAWEESDEEGLTRVERYRAWIG